MTAYLAVALAALFAAGLTLYSGFGLGTLLLPVFALFFPAELAVVATALVHGANNVFKVSQLGRHADREVVLKFGLPAILAAPVGSSRASRSNKRAIPRLWTKIPQTIVFPTPTRGRATGTRLLGHRGQEYAQITPRAGLAHAEAASLSGDNEGIGDGVL